MFTHGTNNIELPRPKPDLFYLTPHSFLQFRDLLASSYYSSGTLSIEWMKIIKDSKAIFGGVDEIEVLDDQRLDGWCAIRAVGKDSRKRTRDVVDC